MTTALGGRCAPLIAALLFAITGVTACTHHPLPATSVAGGPESPGTARTAGSHPPAGPEIEDLARIPQDLTVLAAAAAGWIKVATRCPERPDDFRRRFFAPWTAPEPLLDRDEVVGSMRQMGQAAWYGVNRRKVTRRFMGELLGNCDLESFPSRNDSAIAVAPGHLRGLPTYLPLYGSPDGQPFDMLSYPQVKLNEPLRVLHASRDGVWFFVETASTAGWLEKRSVALADRRFTDAWRLAPQLVLVQDYTPVPDGVGVGVFPAKLGTILPQAGQGEASWLVMVASAGEGGRAQARAVALPRAAAAPFPLPFEPANLAMIGNQMLGQPYGWGEIYGLRDCSALLRDFFLPFGIWLPRTSSDQIGSLPQRIDLTGLTPPEKEALLRSYAIPFMSLLYKPGHIMLYVGQDPDGRLLVFHDAWSVHLQGETPAPGEKPDAEGAQEEAGSPTPDSHPGGATRTRIIGVAALTTLEPGKELGLVPGSSLLDRVTELGTLPGSCAEPPPDPFPALFEIPSAGQGQGGGEGATK